MSERDRKREGGGGTDEPADRRRERERCSCLLLFILSMLHCVGLSTGLEVKSSISDSDPLSTLSTYHDWCEESVEMTFLRNFLLWGE